MSAQVIGAGLRRAPLAIERNNLIKQGERILVAAPGKRGAGLLWCLSYPPSIENF